MENRNAFIATCPLWAESLLEFAYSQSDEHYEWHKWRLEFLYERAVCEWVKKLRERNEKDLARQNDEDFPYYYDHGAAEHAVTFFEKLKHSKGEWARKPFQLEPWQEYDVVRPLFGWMRKVDNTRRFRLLWLEVAKKNGKSTLGAAIGLYLTIGDEEPGAEVYSAATHKDQAKLIHTEAIRMARASEDLAGHVVTLKNNINMPSMASKYEPISGDSSGLDGVNVHGALADEVHRWKSRDLWDVLEQSAASRREPMMAAFTTAGTGRTSFCYQQRDYMLKVLQGIWEDDAVYPYIATLDGYENADSENRDDPYKEQNWVKANPNLGVSIKLEELKRQSEKAKSSVQQENSYLRYRMNLWTEQAIRWLPMAKWEKCVGENFVDANGELIIKDLLGQECYGGLDMATTIDLASFVLAFPRANGKMRLLPFFFLPEDNMMERWMRDKVPYPQWVKEGLIELTPGDAIDYDYVRDRILELAEAYDIREVAFDPYNAIATAQQLEKKGVTMVQHRQGFLSMNAPCKQFEAMVRRGQIEHGGNKVLRWQASNVAVLRDHSDCIRPSKEHSTEKIDGIVAGIMGVGRACLRLNQRSVYEDRGVLHVDQ